MVKSIVITIETHRTKNPLTQEIHYQLQPI